MTSISIEGNLVPQPYHTAKEKKTLKDVKPIEYIMQFIATHTNYGGTKFSPRGPGSRVLVLKSMTGSGKSTVIAPELYTRFLQASKKLIVVTQPRIFTAMDIPIQIMKYYKNFKLGDNLGYLTGSMKRFPGHGIVFETIGEMVMQFKFYEDEKFMNKFAFIIIDEVHVRDIATDETLFYIKQFLSRNWDNDLCPFFIIMSATIDEKIYMDYFDCPKNHFIEVRGLTYAIQSHFTDYELCDYVNYASDKSLALHIENYADISDGEEIRDILIFVQGAADMKKIMERLHEYNLMIYNYLSKPRDEEKRAKSPRATKGKKSAPKIRDSKNQAYASPVDVFHRRMKKYLAIMEDHIKKNKITGGAAAATKEYNYYVCPIGLDRASYKAKSTDYYNLYASINVIEIPILNAEGQVLAHVKPARKIIVATNIIETGATLRTIKYCFDTGFTKVKEFNPLYGLYLFINKPVTQESAIQRKGRVGRIKEGLWYPCYTEEIYNKLQKSIYPNIVSSEITEFILSLIISRTETTLEKITEIPSGPASSKYFMTPGGKAWELRTAGRFDAKTLDFLQYPPADNICYSIEKLHGLGFINADFTPTIFGWFASNIRKIRMESIRMLFGGYTHGANILDLITIAAMIAAEFKLPKKYRPRNILNAESYYNIYKYIIADEIIELLMIWYDFMSLMDNVRIKSVGKSKEKSSYERSLDKHKQKKVNISLARLQEWAAENKFRLADLYLISELRDELISNFLMLGLNPFYNGLGLKRGTYHLPDILRENLSDGLQEICKIKRCIYDGYRYNLSIYDERVRGFIMYISRIPLSIDSPIVFTAKIDGDSEKRDDGEKRDGGDSAPIYVTPMTIIPININLESADSEEYNYEFKARIISVMDGFVDVDLNFHNS